jgi:methylenetetrahydrofolate dehydrogenase (NADP+) / methenyltetrahydrofolate cyclohydrolase / formyltetrahydrofolate synthetase
VKSFALNHGAFAAILCDHWSEGGNGAVDLADAVVNACNFKSVFKFLYPLNLSIEQKIHRIATSMYGAANIKYAESVLKKINEYTKQVGIIRYI